MTASPEGPPQLGDDDVVRFATPKHFLDEYAQNLSIGRLFVRTQKPLPAHARISIAIEVPNVDWRLAATAVVLLARDGYLGLELESFESKVQPTMVSFADEARRASEAADQEEVTAVR